MRQARRHRLSRRLVVLAVALVGGCGTSPATAPAEPPPTAPDERAAAPTAEPRPTAPDEGAAAPTAEPGPTATAPDALVPAAERAVVVRGPDVARTFQVEVAADPSSRREGLMGRTELAEDAGMLFVYPDDADNAFWMKDTLIPLTIVFASADGRVVAALDMEPCEQDPCPTYRPGGAYRMALEVNRGTLDDAGAGWRIEVEGGLPPAS